MQEGISSLFFQSCAVYRRISHWSSLSSFLSRWVFDVMSDVIIMIIAPIIDYIHDIIPTYHRSFHESYTQPRLLSSEFSDSPGTARLYSLHSNVAARDANKVMSHSSFRPIHPFLSVKHPVNPSFSQHNPAAYQVFHTVIWEVAAV